jgi:hypothetical protein
LKKHCKKCNGCLREHERDARANLEIEQANIFRDPAMLSRFNDIQNLDPENKNHLLSVVDGFIKALKFKNIATL